MTRKSNESLMLEVHSLLTNEQVKEHKERIRLEYKDLGLSDKAIIEIIAKEIGINMEERTKMTDEKELKGVIEEKKLTEGLSNGKVWKRWTYKVSGANLTLATFTEYPFSIGQTVKIIYVDNVNGSNTYHNVQSMELDALSVVKEETIGLKPTEKTYPVGHNFEGMTPSQVNEGYDKNKEVKPLYGENRQLNSANIEYFEDLNGTDLSKRMTEFGRNHNVFASQTHVFSGYNARAEPINLFCAFVWWR